MTKKILLKWLETQKAKALAEVRAKEKEAQAALAVWKQRESAIDELIADIGPKLEEVYARVVDWHDKNAEIVGARNMAYGSLEYLLHEALGTSESFADRCKRLEIGATDKDKALKAEFARLKYNVEHTYNNVILNVNSLANAKLGLEYLESLGFNLADLKSSVDRPANTALAVPVNTQFLLIMEVSNESRDI